MKRRQFIKSSALGSSAVVMGATTVAGTGILMADHHDKKTGGLVKKGDVILFQGDSITDAGRSRKHADQANSREAMGRGYAWLAASKLLVDRPADELKIFNRGISGHKVPQLAGRWQKDCFDIKPDVLIILIGVNDIWHGLNGKYDGTPASYEKGYLALVDRTMKTLPDVKLVICEPFVLRCGAVKDNWFPTFDAFRASAKKVAKTFGATFVPFQSMFDDAAKIAPPAHWARDGVHPSAEGASMMAHNWLKAVS